MQLGSMTLLCALCLCGLVIGGLASGYGGGMNSYGGGQGQGYGYSYVPVPYYGFGGNQGRGGAGNGGFFALIGLLFIVLFLFSGVFNFTSSTPATTVTTVG